MTHSAELLFAYETPEDAALVERSVRQEVGDIEGDRTTASVSLDGTDLAVRVDADDLVALRAGINTWSTLVEVAERVGGVA
ncbi:KEOPS complex subunit Pcc1 [Halorarius halobius]|uniref:KEOPS complex subunit Pcc1 n=1 Tax=Halorarius halobius TaxID=2962671 RepID=UPI0020CCA0E5|nr:KEOPS complex subunit Pcc1 [Halorarius halobius]